MHRGAWQAMAHGVTRVGHNLATKLPPPLYSTGRVSHSSLLTEILAVL